MATSEAAEAATGVKDLKDSDNMIFLTDSADTEATSTNLFIDKKHQTFGSNNLMSSCKLGGHDDQRRRGRGRKNSSSLAQSINDEDSLCML